MNSNKTYSDIEKYANELIEQINETISPEVYIFNNNNNDLIMITDNGTVKLSQNDYISSINYNNSTNKDKEKIFDVSLDEEINYKNLFKNNDHKEEKKVDDEYINKLKTKYEFYVETKEKKMKGAYFDDIIIFDEIEKDLEENKIKRDDDEYDDYINNIIRYKINGGNTKSFGNNIYNMNNDITFPISNYKFENGEITIKRVKLEDNKNIFENNSLIRLKTNINNNRCNFGSIQDFNIEINILLYIDKNGNINYITHKIIYDILHIIGERHIYKNKFPVNNGKENVMIDLGLITLINNLDINEITSQPINTNYTYKIVGNTVELLDNGQKVEPYIIDVTNLSLDKVKHYDNICKEILPNNKTDCVFFIDALKNKNILHILHIINNNIDEIKINGNKRLEIELLKSLKWPLERKIKGNLLTSVQDWITTLEKETLYLDIKSFIENNKNTQIFLEKIIDNINNDEQFKNDGYKTSEYIKKDKQLSNSNIEKLRIENFGNQILFPFNFLPLEKTQLFTYPSFYKHQQGGDNDIYKKNMFEIYQKKFNDVDKILMQLNIQLSEDTRARVFRGLKQLQDAENEAKKNYSTLLEFLKLTSSNKIRKIDNISITDMEKIINEYKKSVDDLNKFLIKIDTKFNVINIEIEKRIEQE
jgi:hypothetical protein